ncbi:dual specificity protein phosphatase 18 [Gastrophryne carolinensis]
MDTMEKESRATSSHKGRARRHYRLNKVTESLYISNGEAADNRRLLRAHHITCIINVSLEGPVCIPPVSEYLQIPVEDNPQAPLGDSFEVVADKIHEVEAGGGCTLVHCQAGISRSATLCLAYLMKYRRLPLLEAHSHLKKCRPMIYPNSGFWGQLIDYEMELYGKNTVHFINSPIGPIPDVYEEQTKNMILL